MMRNCGLRGNPSTKSMRLFVDRGVTVCLAWRTFAEFERWISGTGWKWKSGMEVVRKDKYGDFCPENCIVTTHAKAQNLRSNVMRIEGKSVRDIIGDLPDGKSYRQKIVRQRLTVSGWPVEEAFSRRVTPHDMLTKLNLKGTGRYAR